MLDALYISRQPISDGRKKLFAFELSIQLSDGVEAPAHMRAAQVYLEALTNVGFEKIVSGHPAHVDVDSEFLLGPILPGMYHPLVLELQHDVAPHDVELAALKAWRSAGFSVAVDDVRVDDPRLPLLALANYAKIDVSLFDEAALAQVVAQIRQYNVEIVAMGIADKAAMTQAAALGIALFQGAWTSAPELIQSQAMAAKRSSLLHLLSRLYDPRVTPNEIEKLVSQDPVLNLRLLQVANSAMYRRTRPVESIRATVAILGLNQISTWVSLIVMSTVDGTPSQSLVNTMTRAKLCELLARELKLESDRMFTIGLLSSFEKALGVPVAELIKNLSLSAEVSAALLRREGPMGQLLASVEAHEAQDWAALKKNGLSVEQINEAWIAAIGWADAATRSTNMASTPAPAGRR